MAITSFREPLPEDRLSEEERDERARIFAQFAKKLRIEMKTAGLDDGIAIRQLLVYVGKRLDLLDLESRHARGLAQYDALLARTAKPVPQGLVGVAVDALLDLGLHDRERMIRRHEEGSERLIEEISLLAPKIESLLDHRPSPDRENHVLRPSSCLPAVEAGSENDEPSDSKSTSKLPKPELSNSVEPPTEIVGEAQTGAIQNVKEDESGCTEPAELDLDKVRPGSISGKASKSTQKSKISDEVLRKKWLDSKRPTIEALKTVYSRNFIASRIEDLEYLTIRRRVAAVLWFGYDMEDSAISELMGIARRTVFDHRREAEAEMAKDPSMERFLKSYRRRARINKKTDASELE